jgi:hypothetical protein
MFFLCTHCDQGHRHCSKPCSAAARRQSLRRAGAKYQATAAGKRAHCKRQNRYEARRKILTHQSPGEEAATATVPSLPATSTISVATTGGTRTWSHGGTCGTRRWRGVGRDGRAGVVREVVRWLSAQGLSRRAIARLLDINVAAVARAQRAGGTS